jgi:peptidoglycan hydrolase-like protein with peptidoglycan-binding domain
MRLQMMNIGNRSRILWIGWLLLTPCLLAAAQQKAASPQSSSTTTSPKPSAAPAAAPKSTTAPKAKAAAPARQPARRRPTPVRQLRPAKERYAEIQQALADAGHFSGPVNGVWGDSSVKALQEFQAARGLTPTGKIDSQSLIKLNLGPTYDNPQEASSRVSPAP